MKASLKILLAVLCVPALILLLSISDADAAWFPERYNHAFYVTKGLVALAATLLTIFHMLETWATVDRLGRQLRYLALLYFAALVTSASVAQAQDDIGVDYRNLGGLGGVLFIIAAMVVSIREDHRLGPN